MNRGSIANRICFCKTASNAAAINGSNRVPVFNFTFTTATTIGAICITMNQTFQRPQYFMYRITQGITSQVSGMDESQIVEDMRNNRSYQRMRRHVHNSSIGKMKQFPVLVLWDRTSTADLKNVYKRGARFVAERM